MRLIVLLAMAGICVANPVIEILLSEFQVAPDSLERIELRDWNRQGGYDLSGWQVVTPAGVAVINDGVHITGPDDLVVIDRSNTTGSFSLPDSAGFITLVKPWGDTLESVYWPADASPYSRGAWAPPEGMSAALDFWTAYDPEPYNVWEWYVDRTPTFGAPNDDHDARIRGTVLRPGGLPLALATVRISGPEGVKTAWSGEQGDFEFRPGFGTFELTAWKEGFLSGAWPDSIRVEVNQVVTGITVTLDPVGIAEPVPAVPSFRWSGGRLVFDLGSDAEIRLSLFDPAGRLHLNRRNHLPAGRHEMALPGLAPGVYFARLEYAGRVNAGKLVIPRAAR